MKANHKVMKLVVEEYLQSPAASRFLTDEEIAEIDLTTPEGIYTAYEEHCDGEAVDFCWPRKGDIEIPESDEEHRWYSVKYYAV